MKKPLAGYKTETPDYADEISKPMGQMGAGASS
jgi:hypothetical protein